MDLFTTLQTFQFKKDGDSDYLIDSYNELRTEAEQEVSEILDANKSKISWLHF